jgi:hypothetical protein
MATIPQRPSPRKDVVARWLGLPYAVYRLSRRYGFTTSTALTVARAAGYSVEVRR